MEKGVIKLAKDKTTTLSIRAKIEPKEFIKTIETEIAQEEQEALKDFVKGGYRLIIEKEHAVEQLEKEIKEIKEAIDEASKGNWEKLAGVKIPSRFFNESTLRKHGKTLISGESEIRFLDLYTPEK